MYTAPENFYRHTDGTINTEPGEGAVLVAGCGAVMSKAEARERGLLLPEEPEASPEPKRKKSAQPEAEPEPTAG